MSEELKPCPLCGETDIELEEIKNPTVIWDSAMRGEYGYAICCYECGLSVKDEYEKDAIDKWNALPRKEKEVKTSMIMSGGFFPNTPEEEAYERGWDAAASTFSDYDLGYIDGMTDKENEIKNKVEIGIKRAWYLAGLIRKMSYADANLVFGVDNPFDLTYEEAEKKMRDWNYGRKDKGDE